MKKKELKKFAKQLADAELIIQNSTDEDEVNLAKATIFAISSKIKSLEDMWAIDELVQNYLSKNS